jgi:hypothetical protein
MRMFCPLRHARACTLYTEETRSKLHDLIRPHAQAHSGRGFLCVQTNPSEKSLRGGGGAQGSFCLHTFIHGHSAEEKEGQFKPIRVDFLILVTQQR